MAKQGRVLMVKVVVLTLFCLVTVTQTTKQRFAISAQGEGKYTSNTSFRFWHELLVVFVYSCNVCELILFLNKHRLCAKLCEFQTKLNFFKQTKN